VAMKRWILFLLATPVIATLAACGGGSTFNVQNPPPPPPSNPSIAFQGTPPQGILINQTLSLSAVVSNDPTNAGVDWLLTCSNVGNCGTLTPLHTASGSNVTYAPPPSLAGNSQPVSIVAYATANQAINQTASIDITAFGNVLNGTYVFQAQGSDSTSAPFQIAGTLTLDGSTDSCGGYITSGQQTLSSVSIGSVASTISGATGSPCVPGPSYYFVGGDGRGSLTLSLMDPASPGSAITETFGLVVLSSSKALISQIDSTSSAGSFTGTGTLELQDPTAASTLPSGPYAFEVNGTDPTPNPFAYGGILNFDSSGNFLSTNSLMDGTNATPLGGFDILPCSPPNGPSGNVAWFSSASPSSVVTLNVSTNQVGTTCFSSFLTFTGYIVDATHLQLIETDGSFFTAGPAIGQTNPASVGSFAGPYVFSVLGVTDVNAAVVPSSFASQGVICPDGNGGLDACLDANGSPSGGYTDSLFLTSNAPLPGGVNSLCSAPPCPAQLSAEIETVGTYKIDSHSLGRITVNNLKLSPQLNPVHPLDPNLNFYLTGNGTPALVLLTGGPSANFPALGAGVAYPQASGAEGFSFGNGELYGVTFTQQPGTEVDGSGQMTATLTQGTNTGTLSGLFDTDGPTFANPLAGSFACPTGAGTCPDTFGRFSNSAFDGTGVTYYLVDDNHGFLVQTDLLSNFESGGTLQVGLGYFEQRCDVTSATSCQQAAANARSHASRNRRLSHLVGR
jgi:hypothetical protein